MLKLVLYQIISRQIGQPQYKCTPVLNCTPVLLTSRKLLIRNLCSKAKCSTKCTDKRTIFWLPKRCTAKVVFFHPRHSICAWISQNYPLMSLVKIFNLFFFLFFCTVQKSGVYSIKVILHLGERWYWKNTCIFANNFLGSINNAQRLRPEMNLVDYL